MIVSDAPLSGSGANGPVLGAASLGGAKPVDPSNAVTLEANARSQEKSGLERVVTGSRCPQHIPGTVLNPIAFTELARSQDELWIELEGQLYRLRKTKQGKLILTK